MTLTLTMELSLDVDVEYDACGDEIEVLAVWVGKGVRTDIFPSLDTDTVAALEEACLEDVVERRADEADREAERQADEAAGWERWGK